MRPLIREAFPAGLFKSFPIPRKGGFSMHLANYRTSIILAITFTLLLSAFWFFPDLAFIIFLSLLLQLLLQPPVDFLQRKRVPRTLASALVIIAFIALLTGLLVLLSLSFVPTFRNFVADLPNITLSLQNIPFVSDSDLLRSELAGVLADLRSLGTDLLKSSLTFLLEIFGKFMAFVIIIFVTFYLLKDGKSIRNWLAGLFPQASRRRVLNLFNDILRALRVYIFSQIVMCAITGTVVFLYFEFMGLPYASVFAFLSGLGEFVPVLGPTAASAFGIFLTATESRGLVLQTALFYIVLTQVNHNFVYPTLIGKSLNLHPVAIILGIILGGEVLGAPGMFLTVPFIVIVKLVIEDIFRESKVTSERLKNSRWLAKKHDENQGT